MVLKNIKTSRTIWDFILITLGSFIMAVSLSLFLIPNKIVTGGVSGIATILYHTLNIPAGLTMLAINIPLFILGLSQFGKKFGLKTIWGIISLSIFVDFLDKYSNIGAVTFDTFLATLYGGLLLGIGLGVIFKGRGTTGGSDIIARIINKYTNLTLGWSFMVIDTIVILITGLIFKNMDLILFGIIGLGISSKMVDIIAEGLTSEKGLIIISDNWEAISDRLLNELYRGVTGLESIGMHKRTSKKSLYCVVSTRQVEIARRIIKQEDKNAFVSVFNLSILQGEGFRARTTLFEDQ